MSAVFKQSWLPFADSWALSLRHFPEIHGGAFITSSSGGALALCTVPGAKPYTLEPILINRRAHESSISAAQKIDEFTLASASTDGINVWDLRQSLHKAQLRLLTSKKSNFLSLGSSLMNHFLAGGTEFQGSDAEVHIWDLKNHSKILRSFVDSHHDDITAIEFHPNLPYLMSGSTDGCVNVYNLEEPDEDEALHQVINFASVHLCHFVQSRRILVLSHMETLAFWELNNTNYEEAEEPKPNEVGDVRALWPDCEYVVDIDRNGLVAYGANLKLSLTIMPYLVEDEDFLKSSAVTLSPAHGEEVVRDVMYIPDTPTVLTCGEDGLVKAWELPSALPSANVEKGAIAQGAEPFLSKKERKEEKDKRKKDKQKRLKADVRFKPY